MRYHPKSDSGRVRSTSMNHRTAIKAVSRATTPSHRGPDDAVLGDQIAPVAGEVERGRGAERRQPEQEGELDRRGDAAPHGQCGGDGDETPTGARPEREHLGQPDQGGATHGELIERHTAMTLPPHDEEQATGDPRHHDRPGPEEQVLDRLLEHRTDERGRQKGDDETHEQAATGRVAADQSRRELADARPEDQPRPRRSLPAGWRPRTCRRRRPGAARAGARPRADARSTTPGGTR